MPYIKEEDRVRVLNGDIQSPGELNFVLTIAAQSYVLNKGLSYQSINDVIGAFDAASKEFYRRIAEPYEDKKIAENGDVYIDWNAVLYGETEESTTKTELLGQGTTEPEVPTENTEVAPPNRT